MGQTRIFLKAGQTMTWMTRPGYNADWQELYFGNNCHKKAHAFRERIMKLHFV